MSFELSLGNLVSSFDEAVEELLLVVHVLSRQLGRGEAPTEVAHKDPAQLGASETEIVLNDKPVHGEVGAD